MCQGERLQHPVVGVVVGGGGGLVVVVVFIWTSHNESQNVAHFLPSFNRIFYMFMITTASQPASHKKGRSFTEQGNVTGVGVEGSAPYKTYPVEICGKGDKRLGQ